MQSPAGLEQYIALDRPDTTYSVKTALQQMSKPTKLVRLRVLRVARYLKNNPRLIWKFPYQQQPKSMDVFMDADFAVKETMLRCHEELDTFSNANAIGGDSCCGQWREGNEWVSTS